MTSDLLQIPLRDPSVYDELTVDGATPRAHWAPFIQGIGAIGNEELLRRWNRAERRIRENGVTYNIYGDPEGAKRPWRIDPMPLLLSAGEWRYIEAGITQRARLLNLVLEDLYGPQRLLRDGRLPPELLFANPAFLRPLAGIAIPAQTYLHLLAVDLARSHDGQWWVLADRTQAPSGAGYALENRSIVSDVLPELFRASQARPLLPFFRAQRDCLLSLSQTDNPRIVLLTPGPFNETYFEHSYLAQYFGFTLVEGGDLTVRDRRINLKTVDGLQQVDVILRRVDDSFCDPLELRGDSYLGVAGLVDAVAAGNVRIANGLGSGVIETAAIMPFLPGLAKQMLGETLRLPSVATWWCGQDYALDWVLDHLEGVVIKPAFPARPMEPVFGAALAKTEKEKFADQLRLRPYEYVAQEQVALSTAPVWDRGRLFTRSLVLRTYVLNTGSDWLAMPGGLVRVAGEESPVVSMQRGGHSKDAWVLSGDHPASGTYSRAADHPVELRRGFADVPSRAADNLFWLGRYVERSENIARLLRTMLSRVRQAEDAELDCLFRLHRSLSSPLSNTSGKRPENARELEQDLVAIMTDSKRPDSLAAALAETERVGGHVRDRLSSDMMRLIGELTNSIRLEDYILFVEYSALLSGCLELLSAFAGLERENITRGPGWLFMSLGRRLERAIYSVRQLRQILLPFSERELPLLEYLLEVADSALTYRSRYYTALQPVPVLDLLMADETNPRSLQFQLSHLVDLYSKLPRPMPDDLVAMQKAFDSIRAIELAKLGDSSQEGFPEIRGRLDAALRQLDRMLPTWSDNLSNVYFSHARNFPIILGE